MFFFQNTTHIYDAKHKRKYTIPNYKFDNILVEYIVSSKTKTSVQVMQ